MPKRIVFHAGFHKTGTTTIQKTLRANKGILRPGVQVVLRPGMVGLCEAARGYSVSKNPIDLGMIQYETVETLQRFSEFEGTLLLSSEDLVGHMPGRKGLKTYAAAPQILEAIASATNEVFPDAQVSFFFGTRSAKPWLRSCYVQHLRATRITQSIEEYSASHRGSAMLNMIISGVQKAIPKAEVVSSALEDCSDLMLGPLDPLLDHVKVARSKRDRFEILPPANTAPPGAKMEKLLELNRSDLSDADLKIAKRALNTQEF
jgi:hypothetical protein